MREILFRGKNEDRGWIYGDLRNYEKSGAKAIFSHELLHRVEVDPATVGQFTGLTDKNGKKIFEGDIGRYKQTDGATQNGKPITCIGKVIYNAKTASFAVESKDKAGCKYFDYFPIKDFEVIGNIHDNPELLEV
jgi:uncharacterized phage protein (TIGR01671 family)